MKRHSLVKVIDGKGFVVYSGTQKSHMTRMMNHLIGKGEIAYIETEKKDKIVEFIRKNNLLRRSRHV